MMKPTATTETTNERRAPHSEAGVAVLLGAHLIERECVEYRRNAREGNLVEDPSEHRDRRSGRRGRTDCGNACQESGAHECPASSDCLIGHDTPRGCCNQPAESRHRRHVSDRIQREAKRLEVDRYVRQHRTNCGERADIQPDCNETRRCAAPDQVWHECHAQLSRTASRICAATVAAVAAPC